MGSIVFGNLDCAVDDPIINPMHSNVKRLFHVLSFHLCGNDSAKFGSKFFIKKYT